MEEIEKGFRGLWRVGRGDGGLGKGYICSSGVEGNDADVR